MAPCDAQAEIKRLTQENEALRAHNNGLTEQLAKELQTSALLRRAAEWMRSQLVFQETPKDFHWAYNAKKNIMSPVPAELTDIIKPRSE